MSDSQPEQPNKAPLEPTPLKSGRTRDAEVERQIRHWMNCPVRAIVRGAKVTENEAGYIKPEAVVFLFRYLMRIGQHDAAWELADILFERSRKMIDAVVRKRPRFTAEDKADAVRDAQFELVNALLSETKSAEFWEVKYWLCLKCRVLNVLSRNGQVVDKEETVSFVGEGDDNSPIECNPLFADAKQQTPETKAMLADALGHLNEQERQAFILYHYEGLAQEEIAEILGVKTDRTIRNYLKRANDKLELWRNAN